MAGLAQSLRDSGAGDRDVLLWGEIRGPAAVGTALQIRSAKGSAGDLAPRADPVHISVALWADTLGSGPPVLKGDLLRVAHLPLGATLETIGLHIKTPLLGLNINPAVLMAKHTAFQKVVKGDSVPNTG